MFSLAIHVHSCVAISVARKNGYCDVQLQEYLHAGKRAGPASAVSLSDY